MKTSTHPQKNNLQSKASDVVFDNLAHGDLGNLIEENLDVVIVGFELTTTAHGEPIIYATIELPNGQKKTLAIRTTVE